MGRGQRDDRTPSRVTPGKRKADNPPLTERPAKEAAYHTDYLRTRGELKYAPPSLREICFNCIKQLAHVRLKCRPLLRDTFNSCIRDVLASKAPSESVATFAALIMLTPCILWKPVKNASSTEMLHSVVKRRLRRWNDGHHVNMWHDAVRASKKTGIRSARHPFAKPSVEAEKQRKAARAVRKAREGAYGKAIEELLSNGVHPFSPEIIDQLQSKHPQTPGPHHDSFYRTADNMALPGGRSTSPSKQMRSTALSCQPTQRLQEATPDSPSGTCETC